jgi:DNA-binding MurR/RpiR family transcriptional regulator
MPIKTGSIHPRELPNLDQSLVHTIETLRSKLSPRRQEVIRPLFANPREFVLLSLRACAERLHTDSSFLLRVVQQLGFAGFAEFKSYLHDLSFANTSSYERLQSNKKSTSDLEKTVHDSIERSLQNITSLQCTLDTQQMISLARRLYKSKRIFLLGGDMAQPVASYLAYQLSMLGLVPISLSSTGEIIHGVRTLTSDDVVLGITFRKGLRSVVEGIREGKERGAYIVALTSHATSPAARFANEFYLFSVEGTALRSSYIAPFAWVDAFIACCAYVNRRKVLDVLNRASMEQKTGYRWYSES